MADFAENKFQTESEKFNLDMEQQTDDLPDPVVDGKMVNIIDDESSQGSEEVERGTYKGQMDFLMCMIAYAVGLGNVWRFPYLCFKNGGGAFLLVYSLFWTVAAVPVFLLEVTVGQHLQRGGVEVWNICPIFKGVGFANVAIASVCMCYYCIIVTWAVYYIVNSFKAIFPWETCGNWWNNGRCVAVGENITVVEELTRNLTLYNSSSQTSIEQFWEGRVLQATDGIEETGSVQWELLLINLCCWVVVYFALWKGITKARKFVYFCALSPYFMLIILFFRGVTLEGASLGIRYYLYPNITKLADTSVWKDAGTQVFYSYGIGYGALIALGSHNPYNHNCYRDAMVLCVINASTSLLSGFVVFSILGFMATMAQKSVEDVVSSGVGLAFLAYPEAASHLPFKQLWSFLFFFMLAILGMDSQVCTVEGVCTALEDLFPNVLRKRKKIFLAVLCTFCFSLGTIMVTQSGTHWLTLIDQYGASGICLLFIVFFEVVGLSWGFGTKQVFLAMEDMMGYRPSKIWAFFWKFTAPLACILLFVYLVYRHEPLTYADGEPYPGWALSIGYCMSLFSMMCIPIYAIYYLATAPGDSLRDRIRLGLTANYQTRRTDKMYEMDVYT